jgi:chloride channel protein, CIC family
VTRREQLWALGQRSRQVLVLAAVTGGLTGAAVAGFDQLTGSVIFDHIASAPLWVQAAGPLAGLLLAVAALRLVARDSDPSTAGEYIQNFHDADRRLPLRPVAGRLLASVATLGLGGPLGYEGPSLYLGAAIGSGLQSRLSRLFSREDTKTLLVAGAAAGVAAIFKAPATGALFALEVPYQRDLARRMLLPALIAAATSYVTFVSLTTTTPLLRVSGAAPPFDLADLGGAAALGIAAGVGARLFARLIREAKKVAARAHPIRRAVIAGSVLAGFAVAAHFLFHQSLTLGPGYRAITWAADPAHSIRLVVLLLLLRAAATTCVLAGGGVGGLFVPLVVEGALVGRVVGSVLGQAGGPLFPIIGVAAFLGAGYRVPLAAVMFVAESTGRPEFVVPGLIAAVVAQLVMGNSSVDEHQHGERGGHLQRRFALPLTDVLQTDLLTVPPDATLAELFSHHLAGARQTSVPVVDGARYLGLARLRECNAVSRDRWEETAVRDVMVTDVPTGSAGWTIREALVAMEAADTDILPVIDPEGLFIGVATTGGILKLDEILAQTEESGTA